jgi:hypothetical protein
VTSRLWLPWAQSRARSWYADAERAHQEHADDHADERHAGHDHAGHSEEESIEISASGLKNIGYQPFTVKLGDFTRTTTLPAMVVERPGRSQIHITSPLTGVVTKIYPVQGAAVEPGSPMFEVRLTHEELVTAQSELIHTAESLEVVNREIDRLKGLGEGVVAGKRILEQEYEKQKLEASLRATRQALILHGLTEEQVETILSEKQLFKSSIVRAPEHSDENEACLDDHLFHVQQLPVKLGHRSKRARCFAFWPTIVSCTSRAGHLPTTQPASARLSARNGAFPPYSSREIAHWTKYRDWSFCIWPTTLIRRAGRSGSMLPYRTKSCWTR